MAETDPRSSFPRATADEPPLDLSSAPPKVRRDIEAGFRIIRTLDAGVVQAAMVEISRDIQRPPVRGAFARILGLPDADAASVAATLAVFVLLARASDAEAAVAALQNAGFVPPDVESTIQTLKTAFATEQVAHNLDQADLGSRLLPNLTDVQHVLDVRVRYVKEELVAWSPVVILNLATDIEDQHLTCQMTAAQVDRLISTLQRVRKRLADLSKRGQSLA